MFVISGNSRNSLNKTVHIKAITIHFGTGQRRLLLKLRVKTEDRDRDRDLERSSPGRSLRARELNSSSYASEIIQTVQLSKCNASITFRSILRMPSEKSNREKRHYDFQKG